MALPAQWDTRVIKGSRMDFLGNAAQGQIIFTPTAPRIKEMNSDTIIFAKPITCPLQPDGTFQITLPVSIGDTDIAPYFQYKVLEQLTGAPDHEYTIEINLNLPTNTPFDIADLAPTGNVPVGSTALTREAADLRYALKGEGGGGGGAINLPIGITDVTDLQNQLDGRVTDGELTTALANRVTTSTLASTLATYATDAEVATILQGYVTTGSLASTLGGYVTSSALSSALSSYVTSTTLAATLNSYATDAEVATTLQSYQPKGGVIAAAEDIPPGALVGSMWVIV